MTAETRTDAELNADHEDEANQAETEVADALFDRSYYDDPRLELPKVDGEQVDKIALKFSGTVWLERTSVADVELVRSLMLGQDKTLRLEAACSAKTHGYTTNREGDLDVVALTQTLKVHTVYIEPASGE